MDSDLYSPQEHKQVHQIILKMGRKKSACLFFCNEVLRFYSDEELQHANWLR